MICGHAHAGPLIPPLSLPSLEDDPKKAEPAEEEEELVDFEEEERKSDAEAAQMIAAAGGGGVGGGPGGTGIKMFVDLLVDHQLGEKKFEFAPNHTYVFVQASIYDDVGFMMHVSDDPVFFEASWNILPTLTLKAGKLLIPFGTNDFHHIIGGRVDAFSRFLPETWGDFGLSLHHVLYDSENFSAEYEIYGVNGFSGVDEPNIADGSASDNNFWKGLGARVRMTFLRKLKVTTSFYHDVWDADGDNHMVYYAVGAELQQGLIDLPILRHMRIRGEWARGEIQLDENNVQRGLINHAYARTGYYAEVIFGILRNLAVRLRIGRINGNNTISDDEDVEVYEPAILIGLGQKIWWTVAYQFLARPTLDWDPKDPPDSIYGKFFVMY